MSNPLHRTDVIRALDLIRYATQERKRIEALIMLDELIEQLDIDQAMDERGVFDDIGIHTCM